MEIAFLISALKFTVLFQVTLISQCKIIVPEGLYQCQTFSIEVLHQCKKCSIEVFYQCTQILMGVFHHGQCQYDALRGVPQETGSICVKISVLYLSGRGEQLLVDKGRKREEERATLVTFASS